MTGVINIILYSGKFVTTMHQVRGGLYQVMGVVTPVRKGHTTGKSGTSMGTTSSWGLF